jgi:hypothetical protein
MRVNITPTNLYRVVTPAVVVWPEYGAPRTLVAGTILWQHGCRRSSLGGHIGRFSDVYRQLNGYSPTGFDFELHKSHLEEMP